MTRSTKYLVFLFHLLLGNNAFAQRDSLNQFAAPLNIPMYLAGNFGEIRPGHFHAGIDIKTQQVEGLPVLAAADGYVSRVKISLGGYGNALYITHPNGYTTVYGHLQKFNEEINAFILKEQYAEQSFTIEKFFSANQIPVKKGDVVAVSGNSGGSGGPHLHFEIRATNGNIPQNPLKFGFDIKDNIHPIFKNLAIYPLNDTSLVNGKPFPQFFPLKKLGSKYVLAKPQNLSARGVIGFGVEAIDQLNGASNRCGVYTITLKADTQIIYSHQMDAIGFDVTRFINSHVDFYETSKNKRRIQKSFLTSYNKLQIYKDVKNQGKVYFSKYGHDLNYTITDAYGNQSDFDFSVSVDTLSALPEIEKTTSRVFPYTQENTYSDENIHITFPAYSFYEDMDFEFAVSSDTLKDAVTPVYSIQNLYSPLQTYVSVTIKTPEIENVDVAKFFAVSLDEKNEMISPEGGEFSDGWLRFRTRSLGPYTLMLDTLAPIVKAVNFNQKQSTISHLKQLTFHVEDALSGVKYYNAYIDNKWHLLQFDAKTGTLWMDLDYHTPAKGAHTLLVKVGDAVNNFKTFTFDFIW